MTAAGGRAGALPPPLRLSWTQARRLALRAQGIGRRRALELPATAPARRAQLTRTLERTAVLQIDAVSVFARAHHMPVFTREGVWDPALLDRVSAPGPGRLLHEAMAHEAALVGPEEHAALQHRRRRTAEKDWSAVRRAAQADPARLEHVLDVVGRQGPLSAQEISRMLGDAERPREGWGWRRSMTQWMVEYLFRSGRLDCVGRTAQFERRYVLAPDGEVVADPAAEPGRPSTSPPAPASVSEQVTALVTRSARALGIARPADIADYFRLPRREADPAISALREQGMLEEATFSRAGEQVPVLVWHELAPGGAIRPLPPIRTTALVSPFDPIAFFRPRLQTLFDVDYRIGIYTPRERRTHGYYPLLLLDGDQFEARLDLRADRRRGELVVEEAHREALPVLGRSARRPDAEQLCARIVGELERAAAWQGLASIRAQGTGDLAGPLGEALAARGASLT